LEAISSTKVFLVYSADHHLLISKREKREKYFRPLSSKVFNDDGLIAKHGLTDSSLK